MASFNAEELRRWRKASRSPVGASAKPNIRPPGPPPPPPLSHENVFKCRACEDNNHPCAPALRKWSERKERCYRCITLGLECGPSPYTQLIETQVPLFPGPPPHPPPQYVLSGSSEGSQKHSLYQERQISVQDEQRREQIDRGEGFTLQVQEKLSSLPLPLGKKPSSFGQSITSGSGFRDSIDFSRATNISGLPGRKTWNSSNPFAQMSSTISKDNTGGECARQAKLFAEFGQKIKLYTAQDNSINSQASIVYTMIRGTKLGLGPDELEILEREFQQNPKPTPQMKRQFADDMGVDLATINNWFQNRRAKEKQIKKEQAYEAEQAQNVLGHSEPSSKRSRLNSFAGSDFSPIQGIHPNPAISDILKGPSMPMKPNNSHQAGTALAPNFLQHE